MIAYRLELMNKYIIVPFQSNKKPRKRYLVILVSFLLRNIKKWDIMKISLGNLLKGEGNQ